jgi:hypothetical protein
MLMRGAGGRRLCLRCFGGLLFEGDGVIDLRLTKDIGKAEGEQAGASVAGETEEVTSVMYEFMHGIAGEDRQRALLGADEIQHNEHQHAAENRPGRHFAQRNRYRLNTLAECRRNHGVVLCSV